MGRPVDCVLRQNAGVRKVALPPRFPDNSFRGYPSLSDVHVTRGYKQPLELRKECNNRYPIELTTTDYTQTIYLDHMLDPHDYPIRKNNRLRIHTITSTDRLLVKHLLSPKVLTSRYSSCLPDNTPF